jgi:hypothetical protein
VYVLLPHTAGTAVAAELCEHYGGERILSKHSAYHEFLEMATASERSYRVFSAVRNPLDEAVSIYFKYKTDHDGQFSTAQAQGSISVTRRDLERYDFIRNTEASFSSFLRRFYRLPYDNWSRLAHRRFDLVLRFENLQEGFSKMLEIVGAEQVRELPQKNVTGERDERYLEHFTPDTIEHARRVFGPFMEKWGYEFPATWGGPSLLGRIQFAALGPPRYAYWRFIRLNRGPLGRLLRRGLGLRSHARNARPNVDQG